VTTTYIIEWDADWRILRCKFGEPAKNDQIVLDAKDQIAAIKQLVMGPSCLKINGRMSVQVAAVLTSELAHICAALAFFDPKLGAYVVCVTHSPDYSLGQVISDPEPIIV
jgi:CRISPR-associated protein Csx3